MKGPKITITCDCGEQSKVQYGEAYTCACGRRWTTTQIPAADYAAIRSLDRRYRLVGWAGALAFATLLLVVTITRPFELMLIVPAGLLGWFAFIRPPVRRRHYRDIQRLTRHWKLRPEKSAPT